MGDGRRRPLDGVRDLDRELHYDHHRWRWRRRRCAPRHPHRPRRRTRGRDQGQQHPGNPDASAAPDRGTDDHRGVRAARHRCAVRVGRRASSRVLEEPDAGLDCRRQQRHGAHLPRIRSVRSAGPRRLSGLFPLHVHLQHRPPEHLHEVHGSVRARARRATTSAFTRSPSATACLCNPKLNSAKPCPAAAFDRPPPMPSTCGHSPASERPSWSATSRPIAQRQGAPHPFGCPAKLDDS